MGKLLWFRAVFFFFVRLSRYDTVSMNKKSDSKLFEALSLAWELGFLIAVPLGGFIFLGFLGDRFLGTRPIFLIVGVGIGTIVAFYGVYSLLIPVMKDEEEEGDKKEDAEKIANRHL